MNTMVPIFHAQNLLHILKKEKARIKSMNFIQKYMGSVFFGGGHLYIYIYIYSFRKRLEIQPKARETLNFSGEFYIYMNRFTFSL